jgi:hypothetical protein
MIVLNISMPLEDQIPEMKQEHRDLLMLLRAALHGTAPPSPPADWGKTLEIARFHQVDKYLYPAVAGWLADGSLDGSGLASHSVGEGWRMDYFRAVLKYEQASRQLKEILQALHNAEVPVIPLKGAWLAEKIYDEGAQRPMCDFDLLVPLEKLDQARAVFEALGYTTPEAYKSLKHDKDIHYLHAGHPLMIELHWQLWHHGLEHVDEPDQQGVWKNLIRETVGGVPALAFPLERSLVYFAQHILHHSFEISLKAYLDLGLLLRKKGVDLNPDALKKEAEMMRVSFGAPFVIQLALELLGMDSSGPMENFLREARPCAEQTQTAMLAALDQEGSRNITTRAMAASAQATLIGRIKIGMSRVFLHPDKIRSLHPDAMKRFGLAGGYVARLMDLAKRRGYAWSHGSSAVDLAETARARYQTRRELTDWIHSKDTG